MCIYNITKKYTKTVDIIKLHKTEKFIILDFHIPWIYVKRQHLKMQE